MAAIKAGESYGFFTDTSVCIGCKACEVACKEWNQLQGDSPAFLADSFDNTGSLDAQNWRRVQFVEHVPDESATTGNGTAWLMMSDVCKHCKHASCMEVCPTGAIIRTEFDTVVIQQDVCNGCRDCIAACPFGVIDINPATNTAQKCTLCYDRISNGMVPACAQACPTASIKFGDIDSMKKLANDRVQQLQSQGEKGAYLYGADDKMLGGLNSFYLLVDKPEVYGLPSNPQLPSRNLVGSSAFSAVAGVGVGLAALISFRNRGAQREAENSSPPEGGEAR